MPSDAAKKRQAQKRERNKASSRGAQKKPSIGQETVSTANGAEASATSVGPSVPGTASSLAGSMAGSMAGMKLSSASGSASAASSCTGKVAPP